MGEEELGVQPLGPLLKEVACHCNFCGDMSREAVIRILLSLDLDDGILASEAVKGHLALYLFLVADKLGGYFIQGLDSVFVVIRQQSGTLERDFPVAGRKRPLATAPLILLGYIGSAALRPAP